LRLALKFRNHPERDWKTVAAFGVGWRVQRRASLGIFRGHFDVRSRLAEESVTVPDRVPLVFCADSKLVVSTKIDTNPRTSFTNF
jgi:hypothetical protein